MTSYTDSWRLHTSLVAFSEVPQLAVCAATFSTAAAERSTGSRHRSEAAMTTFSSVLNVEIAA